MSGICAVWRKDTPARLRETLSGVGHGLALRRTERLTECADGGTCQVFDCQGRKIEACEKPQFGCN